MQNSSRLSTYFIALFLSISLISGYSRQTAGNGFSTHEFNLYEENGKIGLKDQHGRIIITAQYEALGWSNGKFSVYNNVTGYKLNGGWGLITTENHRITKPEYVDLSPGQASLLVARKKLPRSVKAMTGCINTTGKIIVPFQYDGLSIEGLRAIVYTKTASRFNHGLIDLENNLLIPITYQAIYPLGTLRFAVQNHDNKTAIFSETGKQLTAFLIDSISSFKKNYAIIYQHQRQGLIDRDGQIILEALYAAIDIRDNGTVAVRPADAWLFLNGQNKMMKQHNADSIQAIANDIYRIKSGGSIYLADKNFKALNDVLFSTLGNFNGGKALFRQSSKCGMIKLDGTIVIAPRYENLIPDNQFVKAQQQIENRLRWTLLDSTGKQLTTKHYEYIGSFNGRFFPVRNKNFWGALDNNGKEIVACVHDSIIQQLDDYIVVKFKGRYGIINTKEDWIVTPQANRLLLLNGDRYIERSERTLFLKSFPSNTIYFSDNPIEIQADHLREYLPSGAIWKIDLNGVIADRFVQLTAVERVFPEQEGLRAIKKDGKYGFVDSRNRLRIANRYENVKSFSEGFAAAMILGKWGFINKEDKIAIQPVYEEVFSFSNGFALVKQKNLFGLIDKNGKPVLPLRYEDIKIMVNKRFLIRQNGLVGLADAKGKILINAKYDDATDLNNGYVIVQRDQKFGLLTLEGLSTIPLVYDGLSYDPIHDQYLALKKADWEIVKP